MLPDVDKIKGLCNKLDINPYFVCSEKGTVVYIARTEDEANEFIKRHSSLIELHIAGEKNSKNKKGYRRIGLA
jgi:hydrogenase maturation factor